MKLKVWFQLSRDRAGDGSRRCSSEVREPTTLGGDDLLQSAWPSIGVFVFHAPPYLYVIKSRRQRSSEHGRIQNPFCAGWPCICARATEIRCDCDRPGNCFITSNVALHHYSTVTFTSRRPTACTGGRASSPRVQPWRMQSPRAAGGQGPPRIPGSRIRSQRGFVPASPVLDLQT
ncbi:hypothetical protein CC85DRAFT_27838 [Cutaneotrichosporon oleaginosum]|uniref:Uncharacterized protein n=1 Tax=Cutaneotrichosporon oleaginosum TaxID=879819 RepID=A0A0J0XBT3_9TREE|nr:uncharacterized protein CC85DRAFT_27838 [Cutaneotrichosporon oleaginosum]KLT38512.1 hypothetical protein CC85DRAFT_27838 [Cutaneotrichosporon oleaginosum]TXT12296.1 hypothetical protein COLE_02706 [Cutaneotrichosporon oleaginosum]